MLGSLKELFRERVVPRIAQPSTEAREHGFSDAKIRARAESGLGKG